MAKSAKRLGRGLNSLVSNLTADAPEPLEADSTNTRDSEATGSSNQKESKGIPTLRQIPIDAVDPNPFQPRSIIDADSVISLAESIRQNGILQPVTVRADGRRFQLVAGERRWQAARKAGLKELPAVVRDASNEEMLELALIENLQREDLNAIDRAKAYRRFCDEFSLKADQVAQRMGEDRTTVTNYLRLLDLGPNIQQMVADGSLSMGHARCLLGVASESERERLAASAKANELSVRALEEIVRRKRGEPKETKTEPPSAHVVDLQRRFEESLKTRVTILEGRRKGTGRIVIQYFSIDDFERIADSFGIANE